MILATKTLGKVEWMSRRSLRLLLVWSLGGVGTTISVLSLQHLLPEVS